MCITNTARRRVAKLPASSLVAKLELRAGQVVPVPDDASHVARFRAKAQQPQQQQQQQQRSPPASVRSSAGPPATPRPSSSPSPPSAAPSVPAPAKAAAPAPARKAAARKAAALLKLPCRAAPSPCLYRDHANIPDDNSKHLTRGGVTCPFPLRLHELLDRIEADGLGHVVSWQPHGRAFLVHHTRHFVDYVMPKYFKQTKMASFQRQLNLYGFQRITTGLDRGAYYHELFLRGRPFLATRMTRTRVKGTGVRMASCPETEPNFYGMPPVPRGPPAPATQPQPGAIQAAAAAAAQRAAIGAARIEQQLAAQGRIAAQQVQRLQQQQQQHRQLSPEITTLPAPRGRDVSPLSGAGRAPPVITPPDCTQFLKMEHFVHRPPPPLVSVPRHPAAPPAPSSFEAGMLNYLETLRSAAGPISAVQGQASPSFEPYRREMYREAEEEPEAKDDVPREVTIEPLPFQDTHPEGPPPVAPPPQKYGLAFEPPRFGSPAPAPKPCDRASPSEAPAPAEEEAPKESDEMENFLEGLFEDETMGLNVDKGDDLGSVVSAGAMPLDDEMLGYLLEKVVE